MQLREIAQSYQLQKILKSSRWGSVLRGTDVRSGQAVVVKLLNVAPALGPEAMAPAFEKLAATLGGLRGHPHLPVLLDHGFATDGSAFLVFEPLEGKSVDDLAGASPATLLKLVGGAMTGWEALASRGLPHLNLSPDNLLVAAGEQVKLLGLGTALFRPRDGAAGAENARFLAPEVLAGAAADWRADLYSLARITCQLLGATVGFGETPVVQFPLAVSFELESDEPLRQVLERSLRQSPAERPMPRDFREALVRAVGAPLPAAGPAIQAPAVQAPVVQAPAVQAPLVRTPAAAPPPVATQPSLSQAPPPRLEAPAPMPALAPAPSPPPLITPASPPPAAASLSALPPLDLPPLSEPVAPEGGGDLLSAVDEEALNALLSVPLPPPRTAGAPTPQPAKAPGTGRHAGPSRPAAAAKPAARGPWFRQPLILGGAVGVLVLALAAAAWWFFWRPRSEPAPAAPQVALSNVFRRPPIERLDQAKLLFAQGDDLAARRILRSIAWGEQGLLPPRGCREMAALEEALSRSALERLPTDLAAGLRTANLEQLQSAVEAGAGQEASLPPEVQADFSRARGVVDAYAQARAAAAQKQHVQVLERFATLTELLPGASDPEDLRGKAAVAVETQAEALAREAKYVEALAGLEPLERTWKDRPGLKERLQQYRTSQEEEPKQEALLATLPNIERRKKPHEGLEALSGVKPTPHLEARFAEDRKRLEDLLARLDAKPPELTLRDGYLLDYSRGTVVDLSFRAKDDYEVKSVKLLARRKGGKYRELPLEKSRAGSYSVEVSPDFHQNETFQFYVVATDISGHETYLGSPDKPQEVKRKQGFERLVQ